MKRCIRASAQFKEGYGGEHTNAAEELCVAGGHHRDVLFTSYRYSAGGHYRDVLFTSYRYSNVNIVNHDRFYQSLINNMDARLTASPDIRELLERCVCKVPLSSEHSETTSISHRHAPTPYQCRLLIANVDECHCN